MRHFARSATLLALIAFCSMVFAAEPQPVNPDASPEARALLALLDSISGKGIISGQHNFPNDGSRWTDRVYDLTAKYPGLFGADFGFSGGEDKDSVLSRPEMIEEVKRQYRNGAIIALTWHAVRPTDDEPVTFRDSVQGQLTDYEWRQLLTPGTPLYNRWCEQVDVIAGYLRQLRDAHVPVLFRPYHEMNGNWFWWGGRPGKDGSLALYRQLHDRFINLHHLNNLLWVWNVNAPGGSAGPVADYFPGSGFVDVATMDIYGEFTQEDYITMLNLAKDKPIALAEVGGLPTPEVLKQQPRWAYFMEWSGLFESNPTDLIHAVYQAPEVIHRDDPRLAGPMAAIRKSTGTSDGKPEAVPVTTAATSGAKTLLERLSSLRGTVLSGQQADPSLPDAAYNTVAQTAGKQPAIFSAELATATAESQQVLLKTIHRAHLQHAEVRLTWSPARPTDNGAAKGQLSDYEWNELLTPGSDLNKRWCAQIDEVAIPLHALQEEGVAVLWDPLPMSNGKEFWWAGRKGIHGSAALYRMLFERLTLQDGIHNLVWLWEATVPTFGAGGNGIPSEYFPGLLYADALELQTGELNPRFAMDRYITQVAVGKPVGIVIDGDVPASDTLTGRASWGWFTLSAGAVSADRAPALRALYDSPKVVSLSEPAAMAAAKQGSASKHRKGEHGRK